MFGLFATSQWKVYWHKRLWRCSEDQLPFRKLWDDNYKVHGHVPIPKRCWPEIHQTSGKLTSRDTNKLLNNIIAENARLGDYARKFLAGKATPNKQKSFSENLQNNAQNRRQDKSDKYSNQPKRSVSSPSVQSDLQKIIDPHHSQSRKRQKRF